MDPQKQFIALQEKADALRALVAIAEVLKQPSLVALLLEESLSVNRQMQEIVNADDSSASSRTN